MYNYVIEVEHGKQSTLNTKYEQLLDEMAKIQKQNQD